MGYQRMYKYIKETGKDFDELALILSENVNEVFVDLETTGLDPIVDKILLLQIMAGGQIFIYDLLKLNNEHLKYLINLLQFTKVTSVFHNAKFDLKFIYHNTGIWMDKVFDTMNCEVLINAGVGKSTYKLKDLVAKYCGIDMEKESRELFYKQEVHNITEQMLIYAAKDVQVLTDIYHQQTELIRQAKEEKVLEIEMGLLPVVAKMEYDGVLLNQDEWLKLDNAERERFDRVLKQLVETLIEESDVTKYKDANEYATALAIPVKTKKLTRELELLTTPELIKGWASKNFNINSPKQLKTALNLIGIDVESVDKKVLKKMEKSKVIDLLLERSESSKRISTYGRNVIEYIHPVTGRIHTEFLNMGAASGRFSSGNPLNLQNIPNASGYRECFIASPDYEWLSLDYSQQEFRLAGAISREQKIIDAYIAGADMHTATASIIYNKPLNEIDKKERFVGKTANFTILYGGTEWALGRNLDIPIDESLQIIKLFKEGFPTLSAFKEAAESAIIKLGYSSTPLGRRRYNPPKPLYMTGNEYVKFISKIKREGFNHIIQGGAADITKIAMLYIARNNPFGDKLRMLIQVHDEINLEAHKSIANDAVEFVREQMLIAEQPFLGEIPAAVDANTGSHWIH